MFDKILNAFLEVLKLAPRYLVAVTLAAVFLLFGPDRALKYISVYDFAQNYRQWIGIVLVVFIALLLVYGAKEIILWIWNMMILKKALKTSLQRLHALTEEEKQILRFYIAKETKTNVLCIDDGVVQGLVSAGIIYRSSNIGTMYRGFAHNIFDFAWDYLHENPHLLKGTTKKYRTENPESFEQ